MPGGDRTGPAGAGPRTGRAAGFCTGSRRDGYQNFRRGRGPSAGQIMQQLEEVAYRIRKLEEELTDVTEKRRGQ